MAVFSLIAVVLLLEGMVLLSVRPWEDDSVAPGLVISPYAEIGLGDSVAVAPPAREHGGTAAAIHAGRPVEVASRAPAELRGGEAQAAVWKGRVVRQVTATPHPAPSPAVAPPRPQLEPVAPPPMAPPETVPAVAPPTPPPATPHLIANFEEGMRGWSASVGDVFPGLVRGTARDGQWASAIRLVGSQSGAHLVFADATGGPVRIEEGEAFAFGFSFYIQAMTYGTPGADNLIMRFTSDGAEGQVFGLQLWDPAPGEEGDGRGLWSSGEAMGGERFLAPVTERAWHDVVVSATASSQNLGSYEVYLDDQLVDTRGETSIIVPGRDYAQIEVGLLRDPELVRGTSEVRIDASKLGVSIASVRP